LWRLNTEGTNNLNVNALTDLWRLNTEGTNNLNVNALTDLYGGWKLGDGKTNVPNLL
jgi:hypothetical protein